MRRYAGWVLAALTIGCGDDPFEPERSVRLALEVQGLPAGAAAEYRVFVDDTIAVAHGELAGGEIDTVRISSSAPLKLQWQNALARVGEADFVFAAAQPDVRMDQGNRDTTVTLVGSYALASGGVILNGSGVPVHSPARWFVWGRDDSLLAYGNLRSDEVVRRGDIPPGSVRVQLDTIIVELDGLRHAYAPAQHEIPLNVAASLGLTTINALYALASAILDMRPTGLPPGALAPWGLNNAAGSYSLGGLAWTDSLNIVEFVEPTSYSLEWGEVTVDGTTYAPELASQPVILDPRIEPYVFEMVYQAQP